MARTAGLLLLAAAAAAGEDEPNRWEAALRETVAKCDRIRVRSGGTCHRRPERERTLFEVRDAGEIESTVRAIRIAPHRSWFHCMCCGEPTIEFYAGDTLLASLGFHHGQSLRWLEGEWRADAALAAGSAEALCRWLARHGVAGPLKEHEENVAEARSREARDARYRAILGDKAYGMATTGVLPDAVRLTALYQAAQDDEARALLCWKLLGCHEGSWERRGGLDGDVTHHVLPKLEPAAVAKALAAAEEDAETLRGAARWVLGMREWKSIPRDVLDRHVAALGRCGLAHPRAESRRVALISLRKVGGAGAIAVLRAALAGEVVPRQLAPEEAAESGSIMVVRGEPLEIREATSDRAIAAWFLAELGDNESAAAIRRLAAELEGSDRALAQRALEHLSEAR